MKLSKLKSPQEHSGFPPPPSQRRILKFLKSASWTWLILGLVLFIFAAVQYAIVRYQIARVIDLELKSDAAKVAEEAYRERWKMEEFRNQSYLDIAAWYVVTERGQLLDVAGSLKGLVGPIRPLDRSLYDGPSSVSNEAGELWRLLGFRLDKGSVIVGIPDPEDLKTADKDLQDNLKRFGITVEQALKVKPREIDQDVHYAVVSDSGELLYDLGGVPLETISVTSADGRPVLSKMTTSNRVYRVLREPILDIGKKAVGVVIVYRDITLFEATLHRALLLTVILGALSWVAQIVVVFRREISGRRRTLSIDEAVASGEGEQVEFKESFQWDTRRGCQSTPLRKESIRTVAAFLNTMGGQLFLGIADDGSVRGIAQDLMLVGGSQDKLQLLLGNMLSELIGRSFSDLWHISFKTAGVQMICELNVDRASEPAFVRGENDESEFHIRAGNATRRLDARDTHRYIQHRWG